MDGIRSSPEHWRFIVKLEAIQAVWARAEIDLGVAGSWNTFQRRSIAVPLYGKC